MLPKEKITDFYAEFSQKSIKIIYLKQSIIYWMKNNSLILGIVLSTLLVLSTTQGSDCCGYNTVRVKGEGEARVKPDIAIIYVSLNQEGTTVS